MIKVFISRIVVLSALLGSSCQEITTFSVEVPASELDIPYSINLDSLTELPANSLSLWETSDTDTAEGGIVMLSHPSNHNHPEPLRIWDKNGNDGRGDVFVNFSPTKDKNWLLEPNTTYTLKYRLVVFNGKMTIEEAEAAWVSFSLLN